MKTKDLSQLLQDNDDEMVKQSNILWTVDDVAHFLRLKPETVRIMARKGKIPSVKVGRMWRFSSIKIQDWVIHDLFKLDKN